MTTSTSTSAPTRRSAVSLGTALRTGAVAGVIAGVTNVVTSAIARGPLGASDDFVPLTAGPVVMWTMLGAIIGAVGWRLIVNTYAHSRALLSTLVPTVLVLSLIPDVALLATDSVAGRLTRQRVRVSAAVTLLGKVASSHCSIWGAVGGGPSHSPSSSTFT
jgi:hypothetical protein